MYRETHRDGRMEELEMKQDEDGESSIAKLSD